MIMPAPEERNELPELVQLRELASKMMQLGVHATDHIPAAERKAYLHSHFADMLEDAIDPYLLIEAVSGYMAIQLILIESQLPVILEYNKGLNEFAVGVRDDAGQHPVAVTGSDFFGTLVQGCEALQQHMAEQDKTTEA